MGDIDEGRAHTLMHVDELHTHLGTELGVQIGKRFVHHKHARFFDHGTGECHTLTLATGEVRGLPFEIIREAYDLADFLDTTFALFFRDFFVCQTKFNVFFHGHGRIERIVLEHHGDITLARRNVVHTFSVNQNISRRHSLKTCDHTEGRRLSASGRTDENGKGAIFDFEIHMLDHYVVAISLRDIDQ